MTTASTSTARRRAVPAIGPRLRIVLVVVLSLLAVIGANSGYLAAVTFAEWSTGETFQNWLYQWMFLAHLVLGFVFLAPFLVFGVIHMLNTRHRKNRRAVRVGYALFAVGLVVLISGGLLFGMRATNLAARLPAATSVTYWAHVITPLVAVWLYWLHRLVGPKIRWKLGLGYAGLVAAAIAAMVALHAQDPRKWHAKGPEEGSKYFEPSLARTATGNYIPAETLMMDSYCQKCHADVHAGWEWSAHHLSSFNNPMYLASVRETREVAMERDGSVQAARWCAGCHDPVPFYSGAFDDPLYDDVNHPTAHAGITCTTCHAITHVNSTRGNADYTIDEPLHYPFATSDNELLQWINHQLVKAKPAMHKKTFLKDFHKDAEFCSTCHKVSLPGELTHYKDFLRGQNHYDSFLLSGVSGHGARSFYYPPVAKTDCNDCHMPLVESDDFAAAYRDDSGKLKVHDHLFPSANTGLAWLYDRPEVIEAHREFLEGCVRVDIFGIREGGEIDGRLIAPLRPEMPVLEPGKRYLLETVIRTLTLGHLFTQGTVDSNEIWLDITVESGGTVIGRSGGIDPEAGNEVDRWAHFVNVFMLDRDGNRINRRNAQDIFVPLYNHQIPPGAAATVHYGLELPPDVTEPVTVTVKLNYRKFDAEYMQWAADRQRPEDEPLRGRREGEPYVNELPVLTLAEDRVTFAVTGSAVVEVAEREIPEWQRWNDYGIGLLLKGKAELRQAEEAFAEVERFGRYDGPLNLARVYFREGRLDEATEAIGRAAGHADPPAPPWTMAWLSGQVNRQQGRLEEAEANFRSVLEDRSQEMLDRRLDFSRDYEVRNLLGLTLYDRASQYRGAAAAEDRRQTLEEAARQFEMTLKEDEENAVAHYNLGLIYGELGNEDEASEHRLAHERYKMDDNAADRAVRLAREKYPAANHAAEAVVIYSLQRPGAPELPVEATARLRDDAHQAAAPTASSPTAPSSTAPSSTNDAPTTDTLPTDLTRDETTSSATQQASRTERPRPTGGPHPGEGIDDG
jgi:tetratricopeptide (TPR) repeat protein